MPCDVILPGAGLAGLNADPILPTGKRVANEIAFFDNEIKF
jgi:hypothetical protein